MAKLIFHFICMSIAFFGYSQSVSFVCEYINGGFGYLGATYQCSVQNFVNITTLDAAQVDTITGTHLAGYNNDNVEGFWVNQKGKIHYFPRGLSNFFKNLKGIAIHRTELKEIHQSDLKDYPQLMELRLYRNNLKMLEENLFEFNPNLEYIELFSNIISHIDPNVFNQLVKLKTLDLQYNTCINIRATNPTALQNIIKEGKTQCTKSGYLNLEQKVINLEIESKNLNLENLTLKVENLENEIKSSKFSNTFHRRLQDLKSAQTTTTSKMTTTATTTTTKAPKKTEISNFETCSALESKIDKIAANLNYCVIQAVNGTNGNKIDNDHQQNELCAAIKEDLRNQTEAIGRIDNKTKTFNEAMDTRLEIMEENVENLKMAALREIQNVKNAVKDAHHGLMMSMNFKAEKIERKIEEQNRKFEENFAIIMKALKIDD